MTDLLWTPAATPAVATVLLAHGAGAGMDWPFMNRVAEALAAEGLTVARFEFPYMAARRKTGKRRPPPAAETLVPHFRAAVAAVLAAPEYTAPLVIAGKSMGGRVAAMAAGEELDPAVVGVACFGYPFLAMGATGEPRLAPLVETQLPVLVLQGERDEYGDRTAVEGYDLPAAITIVWIADGSHDFGPRGQSPATLKGNVAHAAAETAAFTRRLASALPLAPVRQATQPPGAPPDDVTG